MPTKLGKYEIKSELGRGAMGVVYCAQDMRLGRLVALKTMSSNLAGDPDLLKRFYREAQSAGQLRHPNIVTIYDIDEAEGIPFIAMEFLEGDSLEKIIAERRDLTVVRKLDILIQTLKGLHYAHQHGIIHRDVKPANILVLNDGLVKIVDFGIARVAATSMTRTGIVLGTPMYMSPEQISGQTVDARADIFSVGVILYEFLTFQNPFAAPDVPTILYKIMSVPPTPITELVPKCPPQLEQILRRAVTKNREERYQSAEDMAFELQHAADSLKRLMLDLFVQQGQSFLEEGNLTLAKESLQKVLEIDSQHNLAKSLLSQVQSQIHSRQRAQRVQQLIRQAKEVLQAEQYDEAISLLEEVLQFDPGHTAAQQYKQVALERRDRLQKISRHIKQAEKFVADADLKGAKAELESALTLDRSHAEALKLMGYVQRELSEQERLRQIRQYTEAARTHLAEKNFSKAAELLVKARELDPVNIEVETLMRLARTGQEQEERRQRLFQRLADIEEAVNREEYELALDLADQALQEFPDDAHVRKLHAQASRLTEIQKKRLFVDEQLQAARDFVQKGQYGDAIAVLERALETAPEDARLAAFLKTVQEAQATATIEALRRQAIREANDLIRHKDFSAAIVTLERALATVGNSPELGALLQYARDQKVELERQERVRQVLSRAHASLREENFEEAVRLLERAQGELKGSEIAALLTTAREEWQKFEQRREENYQRARQLLDAGEPAKAVAVLDTSPTPYFKNAEFQSLYAQCREAVKRAAFIQSVADRVGKHLAGEEFAEAEAVLRQALGSYAGEPALLSLQNRLRDEHDRSRRRQWSKVLDEARVALTRMEYRQAIDLLSNVAWDSLDLPDLASEAWALLKEVRQREADVYQKQTVVYRPTPPPPSPTPAPASPPPSDAAALLDSQKRLKEALQARAAPPEAPPAARRPPVAGPPPGTAPSATVPASLTPAAQIPPSSPGAAGPVATPAPAPATVWPRRAPVVMPAPPVAVKRTRVAPWAISGAAVLVLAALVAYRFLVPARHGYVQLSAAPWAEVVSVQRAEGGTLNITGQTPLELELAAGKYVIELRNARGVGKVEVTVESGKVALVNYRSPEVNVDAMVDELLTKY